MERSLALAVVVLAAGSGSRYSDEPGAKLLAPIDGKPLLVGILEEVRRFGPIATVVVLGHGAVRIEGTIDWRDEVRVTNPDPGRGLATSLQLGVDALRALPESVDGAFIVLGDQPCLGASVMSALASAATNASPDRHVIVPRYQSDEGPSNPVLLLRPAWGWVEAIMGDHGLAPLIADRPDSTLFVPVPGAMPDVDTVADVAHLERGRKP